MSNESGIGFLYLSEQDMIAAGVDDMDSCMESIEDMFRLLDAGDYRMGGEHANEHGIRVSFPKESEISGMPLHEPDKRFMAMPAYLGGRFRAFGIKSYGSNPHNKERGLPRSILMMSLLDVETGAPLAYMSANILSAMRTGAATGVGAKYLSRSDSEVVSIIGPGVMSSYTLDAILVARPSVNRVKVKGRSRSGVEGFVDRVRNRHPRIVVEVCDSIEEACGGADIVFFGHTNAAEFEDNPRLDAAWLKPGSLAVSASALLIDACAFADTEKYKLVADDYAMYEEWGGNSPLPTQKSVSTLLGMGFYDAVRMGSLKKEDVSEIGAIIRGRQVARDDDSQIVLYAVGGLPIEDVAWGFDCYKKALGKGIGTLLSLWDAPALMK